ncbi:uncharacterized protein [Ptychodera flava]|uniref:uncharacterized protein n=1 Tax=Ptychodera flava TaxID=63121 RepID=UPI00396A8280
MTATGRAITKATTALQSPVINPVLYATAATRTTTSTSAATQSLRTSASQSATANTATVTNAPVTQVAYANDWAQQREAKDRFERALAELRLYAEREESIFNAEEALARLQLLVNSALEISHPEYSKFIAMLRALRKERQSPAMATMLLALVGSKEHAEVIEKIAKIKKASEGKDERKAGGKIRGGFRCWRCGRLGHIARNCYSMGDSERDYRSDRRKK